MHSLRHILLIWVFGLSACGYYHEPTPKAADSTFTGKETLGFEIVQTIVLRNHCLDCHSAERGNRAGINLETYANVKALSPRVVDTMASGVMPLGGPRANAADVEVLRAWLNAGAPETSTLPLPNAAPTPEPVPTALDFTRVKAEILAPHCIGCHASFATYTNVALKLNAIQTAVDTNAMPKGGPALPAELKQLLNAWITAGAAESADAP